MPINDKFTSENPYVLTAKALTADNNQSALLIALDETSGLRASAVIFQPQGLTADVNNPVPTALQAAQGTIGAALGGAGAAGAGGVPPCFVGDTLIWMANDTQKMIKDIEVGTDIVKCFDSKGKLFKAKVTDMWIHEVKEYARVWFGSRHADVTPNHRYWTKSGFVEIGEADFVMHSDGGKGSVKTEITKKEVIKAKAIVYNITIEKYHTYFANGDFVSNLKPLVDPNEPVE